MKKRTGFVSNSSSSSFVLFASEKVFDEALKECTEIQKEVVERYIYEDKLVNGVLFNKFAYYHSSEEIDEDLLDIIDENFPNRDEDDYSMVEELEIFVFGGGFDTILETKAKELNEIILSHEEGC